MKLVYVKKSNPDDYKVNVNIDYETGNITIERKIDGKEFCGFVGPYEYYFIDSKSCINCEHFCWWDGDYCCSRKMRILQESKDGEFNENIIKSLTDNKDCIDYLEASESHKKLYEDAFNKFITKKNKK